MRTFQLLILTWSLSLSLGRTVHYDLTISYFNGAPDGVPKRVLGINGNFPGPTLRATIGDWLEVNVINRIQDGQGTTIHFHGIEMRGHQWQDGPRMLTQCDIPSGANYTYRFPLEQSGTYWFVHLSNKTLKTVAIYLTFQVPRPPRWSILRGPLGHLDSGQFPRSLRVRR